MVHLQSADSRSRFRVCPPLPLGVLADSLLRLDPMQHAKASRGRGYGSQLEETAASALEAGKWLLLYCDRMAGRREKWLLRVTGQVGGTATEIEILPEDGTVLPYEASARIAVRTRELNAIPEVVCAALRGQANTVYGIMHPSTKAGLARIDAAYDWQDLIDFTTGRVQDGLQEEFLTWSRSWCEAGKVQLGNAFPVAYATAGAYQALDKLLCPPRYRRLHVLNGEYEGAKAIAETYGLTVVVHTREDHEEVLGYAYEPGDVFYLSAPSAIDGNYDPRLQVLLSLMEAAHPQVEFVIDVTYVGLVQKTHRLLVDRYANVKAVVFSLSKTFGVYYERTGGVFLREPHKGFVALEWFKNARSIVLATELLAEAINIDGPVTRLPLAWRPYQRRAIALHKACGLLPKDARPSNASLLALSDGPPPIGEVNGLPTVVQRGGVYRYCLSGTMRRLMLEDEQNEKEGK